MCICKKIRKKLQSEADNKYQKFSSSLLPGVKNVLGVRLPVLRKIAREIYKEDWENFLRITPVYMEEKMLQGMVIGLLKDKDCANILEKIADFIPEIDSWSICDTFCCGLKYTKEHKDKIWNFIKEFAYSEKEYEIRFSHVMMLNYFIEEKYLDEIFELVNIFTSEKYYARMGAAWLISICFIKCPQKTTKFLESTKIDNFTYNKSIQKICESFRVDKETKQKLKLMKR